MSPSAGHSSADAARKGSAPAEPRADPAGGEPAPPNRRWSRLATAAGPLQAKLTVNVPGDAHEQEADRVADQVLRMAAPEAAPAVQRALPKVEEDEKLQMKEAGGGAAPAVAPATEAQIGALRGGGAPLSPELRGYFEPRFGHDLSAVRLHTGPAAVEATRAVSARAFTVGPDIAFAPGQLAPGTSEGKQLLAHELTHTLQQGAAPATIQRSPLSDEVQKAWDGSPKLETLLTRLGQDDVQNAQQDADVDAKIADLLKGKADDLWIAQRIRQGKLGDTTGRFGPFAKGKPVARPIPAFFFNGTSSRRALVIGGVHGTERQGVEVAEMLVADLKKTAPLLTTIVVPSLFPDNAAAGTREAGTDKDPDQVHTNRNFPEPQEDLAAARKAGKGTPVAAGGRRKTPILPENVMLLELLERFKPERIISIHGTWRAGAGGVFFDKRALTDAERREVKDDATLLAGDFGPQLGGGDFDNPRQERKFRQLYQLGLAGRSRQIEKADEDLARRAATQIDQATAGIKDREQRHLYNREDDPKDVPKAEKAARDAHPSIAGNIGSSGNIDRFDFSGGVPGGVSLGGYAPPRGMTVFTVEPPINANTADYAKGKKAEDQIDEASRKLELQSYADAVRTVLLGT